MPEKITPTHPSLFDRRYLPLIIVLIFISLSAIVFYTGYRHHTINTEQILQKDRSAAGLVSLLMEERFKKIISAMESYSNRPQLLQAAKDKNIKKAGAHLVSLTKYYPDIDSLVSAFKNAWIEAGVPMRGTAITMRPASLKSGSKTGPAKSSVPNAATVAAKSSQAKGRSPWAFIAVGVLLLLCLTFVAFAFLGRGRLRELLGNQSGTISPLPVSTQQNPKASSVILTETLQVTPAETPVPAIATALGAVNGNPNDPQVNLALSFAYWDAGQIRPSLQALKKAADLAGPTNTQFFESAGDQFKQRQAWIAAAAMYFQAIKSLGPITNSTPDLVTNYHEALYKASVSPDLPSYLPFDDLGRVEQPIMLVAQARHLYYNGHTDQAHQIIGQVNVLKPHMAEASLLAAEMDATEGKSFEAKQILNILFADLNTPDWVREMAQTLSNKIP